MSFEYWYMFPVAIVIATLANSSGFSGGVLFQPIYHLVLNIPIQNAIATGIATETIGMTSGTLRYLYYKMVELPVGFVILMLVIPGIVVGNHALLVLDGDFLRLLLGIVMFSIASMQLYNAIRRRFGTRKNVPIEDMYGYMWVPPLAGFSSATTGIGMAEISQPMLERGLKIKTKRANATAIFVEASGDWIITILNLYAGLILWELWIFTGSGVIIGGQLGSYVSRYVPDRLVKIVFSIAVLIIAVFYIHLGVSWFFF